MRAKHRQVATSGYPLGSSRALADGRCFKSANCSNATATTDRPIYTDSAYDRRESSERFKSKLKCEESRSKSERFKSEDEDNDNEGSKNFRKRITDRSSELSNVIDDRLTGDHVGRFRRTESFFKRVLRKNIGRRCDRLLRTIKEGQLLVKKNTQQNPSLRKDVQDSLLLRKNILEKTLLDNTNNEQNFILEKEEDIRRNLKKDIKKTPLSLEKNIQRKANRNRQSPVLVKDIQESPRLLKTDIEDSPLLVKKNIQKEVLLAKTHDQENATLVKRDNYDNSLLKKEGTNKDVNKSILLPKKNAEEFLLTKTDLEKQLTQKGNGKELLSSKKNIQKNVTNEISQLTTRSIGETKLFFKKCVQESPLPTKSIPEKSSYLINKNVDDNLLLTKENILVSPLMQLTKKGIQKNLKLSENVFEENIFLVKEDSEKTSQLTAKSSLLLQRNITNDPLQLQLTERIIQDDSLLTKDLTSLAEKENDIPPPVVLQSQLIERDIQENSSLARNLHSPARKVIFSVKQDVSLSEEKKDIPEEDVLSQLTNKISQNNFSLTKKLCSLSEEDISSTEKEEKLLQSTRKTIQNNSLLKKKDSLCLTSVADQATFVPSLRPKQVRSDSINLSYKSSIAHRRCLPKDTQQSLPEFEKKVRKGSNSICKVKRSPSPEEDWPGQESTGFDNSGSADKYDSVVKCKLMVSNRYAERQSIAKPTEEHIKIFKISACSEQLINISEKVSQTDSISGSIESVRKCTSECSNFGKDSKKNPVIKENPVIKVKNFDENLKCRIAKVQKSEKVQKLEKSIINIKDLEETLTNPVIKIDINNLKLIDNLETPYYQRLIQRDSENSFDLINHQFHNSVKPRLPSIVYSKKDPEKKNILNPFEKIEDSVTKIKLSEKVLKNPSKIHTNNLSTSKIINNLKCLNNQRLIQKSSVLIDHQSDNSQLPLIKRKLLESEKDRKSVV